MAQSFPSFPRISAALVAHTFRGGQPGLGERGVPFAKMEAGLSRERQSGAWKGEPDLGTLQHVGRESKSVVRAPCCWSGAVGLKAGGDQCTAIHMKEAHSERETELFQSSWELSMHSLLTQEAAPHPGQRKKGSWRHLVGKKRRGYKANQDRGQEPWAPSSSQMIQVAS